jgi:hypothetical protein
MLFTEFLHPNNAFYLLKQDDAAIAGFLCHLNVAATIGRVPF